MWEYYTNADVECSGHSSNYVHITSKFLGGTKEKWSRIVLLIRLKQRNEAELADVIEFVNDENLIVNDSVFYEEAV